jgi:hypothetical protein
VTAARWPLPAGFSEMVGVWSKGRITGPEPHKRALREASPSQYSQGNGQRATGNGQRATGNGQRATGNGQRATGNGQRAAILVDCVVVPNPMCCRGGSWRRWGTCGRPCLYLRWECRWRSGRAHRWRRRINGKRVSRGGRYAAASRLRLGLSWMAFRTARTLFSRFRRSRAVVGWSRCRCARGQMTVGTARIRMCGVPLVHRTQLSVAPAVSPPCRLSHPMPAISEVFQRAASPTV